MQSISLVAIARSSRVYGTDAEIFRAVDVLGGAEACLFEGAHTLAVGFLLDDCACVVFRGTVPCDLRDWATDLNFLWTGAPRRHAGFMHAWRRIRDQVTEWLAVHAVTRRVVLSGHSLGAALAIVSAFDLSERFNIAAVIAFGAPRVGTWGFRRAYQSRPAGPAPGAPVLGVITWRFIRGGDVISILPPVGMYVHVGQVARVKPWNPIQPLDRIIETCSWLEGWNCRLDYANATPHLAVVPGQPLDRRAMLMMLSSVLAVIFAFIPVSAAFVAIHSWRVGVVAFVLTLPGQQLLRTIAFSAADHPSLNYCYMFARTEVVP